jgi:hypothetical protein
MRGWRQRGHGDSVGIVSAWCERLKSRRRFEIFCLGSGMLGFSGEGAHAEQRGPWLPPSIAAGPAPAALGCYSRSRRLRFDVGSTGSASMPLRTVVAARIN